MIPNATVTLTNVATGATRTTTTNAEGFYKAPVLEVGVFKITDEGISRCSYDQEGGGLNITNFPTEPGSAKYANDGAPRRRGK